jgi:hypothetical protein
MEGVLIVNQHIEEVNKTINALKGLGRVEIFEQFREKRPSTANLLEANRAAATFNSCLP